MVRCRLGTSPAVTEELCIVREQIQTGRLEERRLTDVHTVVTVTKLDHIVAGVSYGTVVLDAQILTAEHDKIMVGVEEQSKHGKHCTHQTHKWGKLGFESLTIHNGTRLHKDGN